MMVASTSHADHHAKKTQTSVAVDDLGGAGFYPVNAA